MKKHLPEPFKRGQYYYFAVQRNGRRTSKSTGCTSKPAAREYVRLYVEGVATNQYFDTTLREYSEKFFVWDECPHTQRLLAEGKSIGRKHVEQMRSLMVRYVWADDISRMLLRDITRGAVIDFRTRLLKATGGQYNSANKALRALKILLSEAAYRGDIKHNPGAGVGPLRYDEHKRTALTVGQLAGLVRIDAPTKTRLIINLLAGTGMRSGELRALTWGKIRDDYIDIDSAMKSSCADAPIGSCKWNGNRTIRIPTFLSDVLEEWHRVTKYPAPDSPVFPGHGGRHVATNAVNNQFDYAVRAWSGRDSLTFRATPHHVRHSVNTLLLISGVSPIAIAQYLGWSAPLVSRVQAGYSHLQLLDTQVVADTLQRALYPDTGDAQYSSSA